MGEFLALVIGHGLPIRQRARKVAWALDQDSGAVVWQTTLTTSNYFMRLSYGSCSSPAVDGDRVYVLGGHGDLACLDTATGRVIWSKNLVVDYGDGQPNYGSYFDSPLVDENRVVVSLFGKSICGALDKYDGSTVWLSSTNCLANNSYSSLAVAAVAGKKIYVKSTSSEVVGFEAHDGSIVWYYPRASITTIPTPICLGNLVFVPDSMSSGWTLHRLTATEKGIDARLIAKNPSIPWGDGCYGGVVVVDGFVYGPHGCSGLINGILAWRGSAGVPIYAEGHLYCRGGDGTVFLVEANSTRFVKCGEFQTSDAHLGTYTPPVVANRQLLLRDGDRLFCYDVGDPTLSEVAFLNCTCQSGTSGVRLLLGSRDGTPLTAERVQALGILVSDNLSTELSQWTPLASSGVLTNGVWQVEDSAPGTSQRFYRLRETVVTGPH